MCGAGASCRASASAARATSYASSIVLLSFGKTAKSATVSLLYTYRRTWRSCLVGAAPIWQLHKPLHFVTDFLADGSDAHLGAGSLQRAQGNPRALGLMFHAFRRRAATLAHQA